MAEAVSPTSIRLALIRDEYSEDISKYNLFRSLNTFHDAHKFVYGQVLDEAENLNLTVYP